jgi:hypothetical protein
MWSLYIHGEWINPLNIKKRPQAISKQSEWSAQDCPTSHPLLISVSSLCQAGDELSITANQVLEARNTKRSNICLRITLQSEKKRFKVKRIEL